jgi:hypothetical protein
VGEVKGGAISNGFASRVVWQLLQQLQQLPTMLRPRASERHSRLGRLLHAQRNWLPYQFNHWPPGYLSRAAAAVASAGDLDGSVAEGFSQSILHALARHAAAATATAADTTAYEEQGEALTGVLPVLFDGVVHPAVLLSAVVALGPRAQGRLLQHVPADGSADGAGASALTRVSVDLMAELVRSAALVCGGGAGLGVPPGKLSSFLGDTGRVLRWRMQSSASTGAPWQQNIDGDARLPRAGRQLDSRQAAAAAATFSEHLAGQVAAGVYTHTAAAACLDGVMALQAWGVQQAPVHDTGHLPLSQASVESVLVECVQCQLGHMSPALGLKRVHCDTTRAISLWVMYARPKLTGAARTAVLSYMSAVVTAGGSGGAARNGAVVAQHKATQRYAQQLLTTMAAQ